MRIQPSLSDRVFISWKHNLLFCILYTFFSIFQKKKRLKRQEKARKKQNAYLYTGRQEIISSLVRYVTAHDTHPIRKKVVPAKNHISLVKYFTPHDTKFILLQNNRKLMLGI